MYVVRMAWYRDDSVTAIRDDVVISIVKTIHDDVMAGGNGNGNDMNDMSSPSSSSSSS